MTSLAERAGSPTGRPPVPRTAEPAAHVGPAELRTLRAGSMVLGLAVLVYLGANLAAIRETPELLTHGWWITALTGRLVFGIALLVVPWFAGAAAIRALALAFAVFGLAIVAASLPAVAGGMTGMLRDQALYAWAAALALRPPWAWTGIVVTELLAVAARAMRTAEPIPLIESSLVSFTTTVLLVILLMAALRAARLRDAGEQAALRAIRQDVDQAASAAERERIERIVHDDVLAALRTVSLGLDTTRVDPVPLARAALRRLEELDRPPDDAEAALDAAVLMNRLRGLVTALAPETEVRAAISGAPEIPRDVALAITEACGEALRNSVLHAPPGREVMRIVHALIGTHAIEVTVADDGEGFDPRRVPPHRLGIARSIVERMRALPGGDAVVRTTAGSGTTVTVSWRA